MNNNGEQLTFRDGKEGDGSYRIPMSASDSVVRIANRQIEWMVLYMSRRYADCGLIAPKNNRAVHCSFGSWVGFEDFILFAALLHLTSSSKE
jgi:hypothetical protein